VTNGFGSSGTTRLVNPNGSIETATSLLEKTVKDANGASFVAYPNPSKGGNITLRFLRDFALSEQKEISISDVNGKSVLLQQTDAMSIELNTDGLTNGLYFIAVKSNHETDIQKLIIQK
jgi:hypothetical protein